mmetsp:Transcript_12517/g.18760  ORF Transcript_12517/g.18760 Transcript_12517/m.18760 type:complete len:279 (+) Transcript_12517:6-842(+)
MGDNIDDNVWDGVNEVDLAKNVNSDDDVDSTFGSEEKDSKELLLATDSKVLKSKQKFAALKESKKAKAAAASESSKSSIIQLSEAEMVFEIDRERKTKTQSSFTSKNFFYPNFSLPQTKSKSKKECPYVRALAVGLPSYKKLLQNPDESGSNRGSPTVLIICASAIRATQIIRSVSSKIIKCKIAKLFAKHIKISEQVDLLASSFYPLATGTPNRLLKLIEIGSLDLQKTLIVLIDYTPDIKGSTILTMKDVKDDFYTLLDEHISKEIDHIRLALIKG